jgi:hypothetical protein
VRIVSRGVNGRNGESQKHTKRTTSETTAAHAHTTASTEELTEQIFRTNLIVKHATAALPPRSTTAGKGTRGTSTRTLKPAIRIPSKAIKLGLLVCIAQDSKSTSDHLESLVCAIVAILVGMGEETEFAVCFFNV